jgi:hypothetical protein
MHATLLENLKRRNHFEDPFIDGQNNIKVDLRIRRCEVD